MLLGLVAVGALTDEGVDAAHARTDRGLAQHRDAADVAGAGDVSAGAQLLGPVTPDGDDPHLLAVLLPEQGHGACSAGGVDIHDLVGDGQVLRKPVVDPLLDAGDLVRSQG